MKSFISNLSLAHNQKRVFILVFLSVGLLSVALVVTITYWSRINESISSSHANDIITEVEDEAQGEEDEESEEVEPDQEEGQKDSDSNSIQDEKIIPAADQVVSNNWWEYPDTIHPTTKSGDDLLVLVNKQYQLPSTYAPSDLLLLQNVNLRLTGSFYARSIIIDDLKDLGSAAQEDSVEISITSAYRSYSTQASTYQRWLDVNGGNVATTDTISARPGHSQHQLGTTLDFNTAEINDQRGSAFNNTAAAAWLATNAWKYGFVLAYPDGAEHITGYAYESWHYRYIGVENAAGWKQSGVTLEEWLRSVQQPK